MNPSFTPDEALETVVKYGSDIAMQAAFLYLLDHRLKVRPEPLTKAIQEKLKHYLPLALDEAKKWVDAGDEAKSQNRFCEIMVQAGEEAAQVAVSASPAPVEFSEQTVAKLDEALNARTSNQKSKEN